MNTVVSALQDNGIIARAGGERSPSRQVVMSEPESICVDEPDSDVGAVDPMVQSVGDAIVDRLQSVARPRKENESSDTGTLFICFNGSTLILTPHPVRNPSLVRADLCCYKPRELAFEWDDAARSIDLIVEKMTVEFSNKSTE